MRPISRLCFLVILPLISCSSYDILIVNGDVFNGGDNFHKLDIAVKDGKIVAIGKTLRGKAKRTLDAEGLVVSPGFIDMHAHLEPITLLPDAKSHVMQGVTTALGGPDGGSPLSIGKYLDSLTRQGIGMNVAYLIGHNTVRNHVMGMIDREPTTVELTEMQDYIERAMSEGAFGISTGLKYLPGAFASKEEVIALASIAANSGGIYTSHLREEGLGLLDGVAEAIDIGRSTGMKIVLTHHKAIGKPMWGSSSKSLALVDQGRREGLDILMDQYPYTASHTSLSVLIPAWSRDGGMEAFIERCETPEIRDSIRNGIIFNIINDRGGNDLRSIQFARIPWQPEFMGKTMHDLLEGMDIEPTVENAAEMTIEIQLKQGANCIYHVIDSADVINIMRHPMTMIASDGRLTAFGSGHPHPRAYGTFPRVLGHYVNDLQVLTLAEALRKMTTLPAETLGLEDRGYLKVDHHADITIFNPEKIRDQASFLEPHQYPKGINYVIINGKIVVDDGVYHDVRAGRALRKIQQPLSN